MQYQVYNKKTGEVVAWIDINESKQVIHKDYDIKAGEDLTAIEDFQKSTTMTAVEYQKEAKRFNVPHSSELLDTCFERPFIKSDGRGQYIKHGDLVYASLGISGEAGEIVDLVKKFIFQEKPVEVYHMEREIGDLLWYIILMCNTLEVDIEEVFQINIDKLSARYPNGFNSYDANHRAKGDI